MHPPDLKLMETENGSCSRGASYSVKGTEISNNISEEALEASYGGDSATTKSVNEKSTDTQHRGESVEVVENLPQRTCNERDKGMSFGDDMVVDRGKSKDNVKAACVDDDKEDNGGPVVGGSGGRSALNGRHNTIMRGQRAQGSRRSGGRRGRGSNCRGGSKSKTQHFKSRCCEEDTNYATDYLYTSRTVTSAYTEEKDTVESVDVDNICSSPTSSKGRGKDNNKDNRGMEDDNNRVAFKLAEIDPNKLRWDQTDTIDQTGRGPWTDARPIRDDGAASAGWQTGAAGARPPIAPPTQSGAMPASLLSPLWHDTRLACGRCRAARPGAAGAVEPRSPGARRQAGRLAPGWLTRIEAAGARSVRGAVAVAVSCRWRQENITTKTTVACKMMLAVRTHKKDLPVKV
ncbi:hypothetical protein Bca52824_017785 [Brassica carinata]|uniref:Uncharacterized protein n=1 Tax=Brassica carinata TaxID=52824 RepID=A0A8X8AXU1_BRACI|nr:hypothetical protein Bca52824_017785 [Brassica carinata]